MKKLTLKKLQKMKFVTRGRTGHTSPYFIEAGKLKTNESLLISKKEWKLETTPCQKFSSATRNKRSYLYVNKIKVFVRTLANGSGWVVTRR